MRMAFFVVVGIMLAFPAAAAAPENIVHEVTIQAPVGEVWRAWTTAAGVQSWMVARSDIDLKVGGLWRTSYTRDADLDGDAAIHHRILAFDPERMLAFQTIKPPSTFPFPSAILKTWTIVYFEPLEGTRTKVRVRMLGFEDDDESRRMHAFFQGGNKATLDALVKRFSN